MVVSAFATAVFIFSLVLISIFVAWSLHSPKQRYLLHKLYLALVLDYAVWAIIMLIMRFTPPDRTDILAFLDALTYACISISGIYLMISLVFVYDYDRLPRWSLLSLIVPFVSVFVSLTNPWHHLQYVVFSTNRSEIVFGPYVFVTGINSYACFILSFILIISSVHKNPNRLYIKQCILVTLGGLSPLGVSLVATVFPLNIPNTAMPLSFLPTILFNGIAVYRYNLLDITPVATQQVLDWTSNCYLILSDKGLILRYNKPFAAIFVPQYGIMANRSLSDFAIEDDQTNKSAIYNILTAVESCRTSGSTISYEQSFLFGRGNRVQKHYYIAEVSPVIINERLVGFVVTLKDVTQLKKSMQQLQENQTRMMEQERFAFLGQMMAGLAHNLKTPIMSISGCVASVNSLVDECESSLTDPRVVAEDYREIYGEMRDWLQKILESSSYMSDIITAIKGQTSSVAGSGDFTFTLEELVKRTTLLMRHELVSSHCTLVSDFDPDLNVVLQGDINNLIQVLNNLLSNAIFAQKEVGGGQITLSIKKDAEYLHVLVKDTGPGVTPRIRNRLFKEMVTSKGTLGSGLGLYISNAVIRGKFGGSMWAEDNPGGGAIFGFSIPLAASEAVDFTVEKRGEDL
ncbi:MAG: PAS domain S-box protein [Clostridiales bacterium]|nr:PAS domain S-box protein [Clostridiales bacterium]